MDIRFAFALTIFVLSLVTDSFGHQIEKRQARRRGGSSVCRRCHDDLNQCSKRNYFTVKEKNELCLWLKCGKSALKVWEQAVGVPLPDGLDNDLDGVIGPGEESRYKCLERTFLNRNCLVCGIFHVKPTINLRNTSINCWRRIDRRGQDLNRELNESLRSGSSPCDQFIRKSS